jgi:hypothetical protein
MKALIYPAVALVFNFILFYSFPMAGGGASLGTLLTIPVIGIISLLFTLSHYILHRKKITTKYFQPVGIAITVLISYFLFIADDGNTPIDIVGRMFKIARNYNKIELTDFYLDNIPLNAEKIVAAKKKFWDQIPDTAYTVNVIRNADYKTTETMGIFYKNGKPLPVDSNVKIRQINKTAIMLTRIAQHDTLSFVLSPLGIKEGESRISGFLEENPKRKPEESLRQADVNPINKRAALDQHYFAYKVFYWLL